MYVSVFLLQHAYLLAYLQKIRKTLAEKIAQLNSDLDDISAQYH